MKFGLEPDVISKIYSTFRLFPDVKKVILYGSRAKGNFRPGSDIDLTLLGEHLDLKVLNQIRLSLDEHLLPYTFDLSVYSKIKDEELLEHIERVGVEFYS